MVSAMKLYISGAVENRAKNRVQQTKGTRHTRYFTRKRRLAPQGRPQKASLVREQLWQWFATVKRSVMSRISPKSVLVKARALLEVYTSSCLKEGIRAVLLERLKIA